MQDFTRMQRSIEYALAHWPGLVALAPALRVWDNSRKNHADAPAASQQSWIRVDTVRIRWEPHWANGRVRYTHTLNVVAANPTKAGMADEPMLDMVRQIALALGAMTRDSGFKYPLQELELEKFSYTGGEIGLGEKEDPKNKKADIEEMWATVADIEVIYEESIDSAVRIMVDSVEEISAGLYEWTFLGAVHVLAETDANLKVGASSATGIVPQSATKIRANHTAGGTEWSVTGAVTAVAPDQGTILQPQSGAVE